MRSFKNSVFMSKKKRAIRPAAFLSLFGLRSIIARKNLSTAMNITTIATTILVKRVNQKIFFLHKIVSFKPSAKQTDATQASHRRGIVTKYLVAVDGAWECSPQLLGNFYNFAVKNSNFNAI